MSNNLLEQFPRRGVFLTGIESSDPWVDGKRRDQLKEAFDFYSNYELRLKNIMSLGISWLRFGPPYSQTHLGKDNYDFSLSDKVISLCKDMDMTVIADLLHFGLPEWLHGDSKDNQFFQNPLFAKHFSLYARAFAKRYPSIRYFTLVNEPFITAYFSSKLGMWNECRSSAWDDDSYFVQAVRNIAMAAILARKEVENVWVEENREGYPIFIQNESFEIAIASKRSKRHEEAELFNIRRFAALDLIFGITDGRMKDYLMKNGLSEKDHSWFVENGKKENTLLGIDHYPTCVHYFYNSRIINGNPGSPSHLYSLIQEYYRRYDLPMLHTETNGWPKHAVNICQNTYETIKRLRQEGYPILGMGWYGDEYQMGWHHALCGSRSYIEESPVGLYYKGEIQPVGQMFRSLIIQGLD